jgi:hypothetical protein
MLVLNSNLVKTLVIDIKSYCAVFLLSKEDRRSS